MDILGVGGPELFVILILAVVVLGPERLARVARQVGRLVRDVKAYFNTFSDELKTELEVLDDLKEVKTDLQKRF